jgi:heptosyltransferase III
VHKHFVPRGYPRKQRTAVVFRTGQLGDTLVALPALELIRRTLPDYRLVLLTDQQPVSGGYVSAWDICRDTGWFDEVMYYQPKTRGLLAIRVWTDLVRNLRSKNADRFYNLAAGRSALQTLRDMLFFRFAAGIGGYHSPVTRSNPPRDRSTGRLPRMEPEWRQTMGKLVNPVPDDFTFSLPIPTIEREKAMAIAAAVGIDFSKPILALAPGSKMPSKKWPVERYFELGKRLASEHAALQIVVFGGGEDAVIGEKLCDGWGARAFNLAGKLSIYGSAAVLQRCAAYVGNDTGTMHLAAICATPCVAIFSARDYPGRWEPCGKGHVVIRREVECAGCLLETCVAKANKCLTLIQVDEVGQAVDAILHKRTKTLSFA